MSSTQPKTKPAPTEWQPSDAAELYRIPSWGDPFFFVNEKGHMAVRALDEQGTTMDVVDIVNELRRRARESAAARPAAGRRSVRRRRVLLGLGQPARGQ